MGTLPNRSASFLFGRLPVQQTSADAWNEMHVMFVRDRKDTWSQAVPPSSGMPIGVCAVRLRGPRWVPTDRQERNR